MGISHYLAMTDGEIANADEIPKHLAYMACHFSPYTTGITQPPQLPPQAMLILNDRIPFGRIPEIVESVLNSVEYGSVKSIADVYAADAAARSAALAIINK